MKHAAFEAQARLYIHEHFPDLEDAACAHTTRGGEGGRVHIYAFKKESPVPGGTMARVVRVTVDEAGKIVKAVSSK